jgi:hypothetical protein
VVVVAIAADALCSSPQAEEAAGAPPTVRGLAVIDAHDGRVVDHLLVGSQPTQVISTAAPSGC